MSENYSSWFENFKALTEDFNSDELYESFRSMLSHSKSTISLNRKIMEKTIDVSWVEAIEEGLVHVDNVMRNPRKTIVNVEEVVPIALSKKITVDSIKHLAQHTDLIQSVDPKTGKITPSKVLNVHKEESMLTYENKFVNTLIDRLYIFINRRYEKLKAVSDDEEVFDMEYNTAAETDSGSNFKVTVKVETVDSLEKTDENGSTLWQRVEKLRTIIESYKASPFCQQMGNNFIRPPVMRTNAIMKNVELKACLNLWQFIESYDKVGYEINVSDSVQKPDEVYIENLYNVTALNLLLFRSFTVGGNKTDVIKTKKSKASAPRIIKRFQQANLDKYNLLDEDARETAENGAYELSAEPPEDMEQMLSEIDRIIEIETEYFKEEERKRIEEEKREQKRLEEQRRREEEERLAREKAEQEERERQEKERLEQERLEKERLAKEQAEREEQERLERERREREEKERIRRERDELGNAIADEIEKAKAENEAVRAKQEKEQKEKEEREKIRADKLKKMRNYLETKSFDEIYPEYSKNPYYVVKRQIKWIISNIKMDGSYIREGDTDQPMLIERIAKEEQDKRQAEIDRETQAEMQRLYNKYAPGFWLKTKMKFKKTFGKKQKKIYTMPKEPPVVRSPEEQKAYDKQMKELFRKYHVSVFEKTKRKCQEISQNIKRKFRKW